MLEVLYFHKLIIDAYNNYNITDYKPSVCILERPHKLVSELLTLTLITKQYNIKIRLNYFSKNDSEHINVINKHH